MPGMRITLSADEANAALTRFRGSLKATGADSIKTEKDLKYLEQQMLKTAGLKKQQTEFANVTKMMGLTRKESLALQKQLQIEPAKIGGGIDDVTKKTHGLGMAFMQVGFAIMGVTAAFKTFVSPSLTYLSKIETATLGIGTSLMMNNSYISANTGSALKGTAALDAAMVHSKAVLNDLRVANLETTATLEQLIDAFQVTLPVAMAKGFNVQQAENFTVAMVKAAGAIGLPFEQLGEETRSLLTENINPRNSRIATVLGLRNEDVRKFKDDAEGLYKFLMDKLQVYEVAGARSAKTWAGLWSNTKDIIQQAMGDAFEPLFNSIKIWLTDATSGLFKIVTVTNELGEATKKVQWNPELAAGIKAFQGYLKTTIQYVNELAMGFDNLVSIWKRLGQFTMRANAVGWDVIDYLAGGSVFAGKESWYKKQADIARNEAAQYGFAARNRKRDWLKGEQRLYDIDFSQQGMKRMTMEEINMYGRMGIALPSNKDQGVVSFRGEPVPLTMFGGVKGNQDLVSDIRGTPYLYYKPFASPKTSTVANPPKKGDEDGKLSDRMKQLDDLRTRINEDILRSGKDERGLIELEVEKLERDFRGYDKKKKAYGKLSSSDEALLATWKEAKLKEIYDKEDKALQQHLDTRRNEMQKEAEEEVNIRQDAADRVFQNEQTIQDRLIDLGVEERTLSERDAIKKKTDLQVKGIEQEQESLRIRMLAVPFEDERLKRMSKEYVALSDQIEVVKKLGDMELRRYDIQQKRAITDAYGGYDPEKGIALKREQLKVEEALARQYGITNEAISKRRQDLEALWAYEAREFDPSRQNRELLGHFDPDYIEYRKERLASLVQYMKDQNLDIIAINKYQAKEIENIEKEKYEHILATTNNFFEGVKAQLELMTIAWKNQGKVWVEASKEIVEAVKDSLSDVIFDFLEGDLKHWEDYIKQLTRSVNRIVANALAENITNMMGNFFNNMGSGGGGLQSLFSGIGNAFRGYAEGGSVTAGDPVIVGEKGTEIFVPETKGTILSNDVLSSFGSSMMKVTGIVSGLEDTSRSLERTAKYNNEWIELLQKKQYNEMQYNFVDHAQAWEYLMSLGFSMVMSGALGGGGGKIQPGQEIKPSGGMNPWSMPGPATGMPSRMGNVFSGGKIIPFRRGGIVDKPSYFPLAGGFGTIAEDSIEAILPLARDSKGRLGVQGGGGSTIIDVGGIEVNGIFKNKGAMISELRSGIEDVCEKVLRRHS